MNMTRLSPVFLISAALVATHALANTNANGITDVTQLNRQFLTKLSSASTPFSLTDEQMNALSQNVLWRRLLMFSDAPKQGKKEQSLVDDAEFFLSKTGRTSAKDELVAMLFAIEKGDDKAVCQFPARAKFLSVELEKLGVQTNVSDESCADFHAWADKINAKSLSLVFAEEHGNNLASAFAHAFMRIDSQPDDAAGLGATAMNYTVKSDDGDGALASAIKPLIGKYAGVMEIMPYTAKADDYLVKDERDLWEYRLNLTDAQVGQIMRHIWEVRHLQRPYYLTHDNCATEIARLVDVVRADKSLLAQLGAVTTPAKAVQIFENNGMIEKAIYHASNSTKRQAITNNGKDFDVNQIKPNDNNPIKASPTHRWGAALSHDEQDGMAYHLTFRSAYQDWLDNPAGVRKFHQVTLPSIDIKYQDDKLKLNELTIFKSTSLNPANTAKAYPDGQTTKKAPASQMYLGVYEAVDASGDDDTHLVLGAGVHKGKSWAMGQGRAQTGDMPDAVCYVLGGADAELGKINQGYRVGVKASMGCIYHHTDKFRMVGEIALPYWYHHDSVGRSGYVQPSVSMGVQYDMNRHHALRITGKSQKNYHQTDNAIRVEILNYF